MTLILLNKPLSFSFSLWNNHFSCWSLSLFKLSKLNEKWSKSDKCEGVNFPAHLSWLIPVHLSPIYTWSKEQIKLSMTNQYWLIQSCQFQGIPGFARPQPNHKIKLPNSSPILTTSPRMPAHFKVSQCWRCFPTNFKRPQKTSICRWIHFNSQHTGERVSIVML